jgi:signal transduction histidine kinase
MKIKSDQMATELVAANALLRTVIDEILNELLDLARIEDRRGKDFVFEAVPLQALVQTVVSGFNLAAGQLSPAIAAPARPMQASTPTMGAIRIIDCGIGMTPEQMRQVCERFYRADSSGKVLGTGLGMSIVKEIMELHHGQIELHSQLGQGTTVSLLFPLAREVSPC